MCVPGQPGAGAQRIKARWRSPRADGPASQSPGGRAIDTHDKERIMTTRPELVEAAVRPDELVGIARRCGA